ncbi:hypothetical protein IGI04_020470 [Brassica rapa subsp. trilocularis]|uniref:Uncharacterized protein n=1 Tax=Brassica rapa subsp. trilocularis TaxID=1813537 RepID=A0ABQ7MIU1_BRACM|nr:hypothetical protein IGI04_020470 [Brassica rapa subsp. trilocularis]
MSLAGDIGKVSLAGDISQVSLAGGILSDPIGDCEIVTMSEGLRLLSSPLVLLVYKVQVGAPEMRESSDIKYLISHGYDLINLLNSKNGFDVESIKDCKKKLEACKKKTEEAYSDESAGDDDIELVADELKDLNAQWTSVDEKRQSLKSKDRTS